MFYFYCLKEDMLWKQNSPNILCKKAMLCLSDKTKQNKKDRGKKECNMKYNSYIMSLSLLTFRVVGVSRAYSAKRPGDEDDVINVSYVVAEELSAITVCLFHAWEQRTIGMSGWCNRELSEWDIVSKANVEHAGNVLFQHDDLTSLRSCVCVCVRVRVFGCVCTMIPHQDDVDTAVQFHLFESIHHLADNPVNHPQRVVQLKHRNGYVCVCVCVCFECTDTPTH